MGRNLSYHVVYGLDGARVACITRRELGLGGFWVDSYLQGWSGRKMRIGRVSAKNTKELENPDDYGA